jgi:hypothetical protein
MGVPLRQLDAAEAEAVERPFRERLRLLVLAAPTRPAAAVDERRTAIALGLAVARRRRDQQARRSLEADLERNLAAAEELSVAEFSIFLDPDDGIAASAVEDDAVDGVSAGCCASSGVKVIPAACRSSVASIRSPSSSPTKRWR